MVGLGAYGAGIAERERFSAGSGVLGSVTAWLWNLVVTREMIYGFQAEALNKTFTCITVFDGE